MFCYVSPSFDKSLPAGRFVARCDRRRVRRRARQLKRI